MLHPISPRIVSALICITVAGFYHSPVFGQIVETPASKSGEQVPENLPPGINDSFLDPEMKVEDFIKRFEVESREVFACREQILAALDLRPGMAVADVGAGTGLYMKALSRSVGESGKVFAVDISPNFVKHLRDRSKTEGLSNVEVVLCSDRNANLPKNSVDRIFICDVYHHFEYPALTMQSLHDALRQDGKLILVDFHRAPKESDEQRRSWLSGHIRAPQETFKQEIIDAGFHFDQEVTIDGFQENYLLQFTKSK